MLQYGRGTAHFLFMQSDCLLVPILLFSCWSHVAACQSPEPKPSKVLARTPSKLKSAELAGKYIIHIPEKFALGRVSDKIAKTPIYFFQVASPHDSTIQIFLLPHSKQEPSDKEVGGSKQPFEYDGTSLPHRFTISGNRFVYYGWSVVDNAYECSMNSPCPWPAPPESRYATRYVFVLFDKPNDSIVEFTAIHLGGSKRISRVEGEGELLRNTIIPSITSIR